MSSTAHSKLKINAGRLLSRLDELGRVGARGDGGLHRLAASDADRDGRGLLADWMRAAGLEVRVDEIGNMFGIRAAAADLPAVMSGSHIDTVSGGGKYDGSYGVLAALESAETLNDADVATGRPFIVACFTNEEGVRYQPDMMGSLVYAGGLSAADALATKSEDGTTLGRELERIGYAGDMVCGSIVPSAFVELHIEQGPVLEREATVIGAVETLQGISWTEFKLSGQANHAGTTPMALRRDAGYCAAAIAVEARRIADEIGPSQVATVGVMELEPGSINVVPSAARLTVDLRNASNKALVRAEEMLDRFARDLAARENVELTSRRLARFDPVSFDDVIVAIIENTATGLGHAVRRMTSGAGHDAQMMARICPTAMIFVPSRDGISHNPAEHTDDQHLVDGANVLLQTVLNLSAGGA